MLLYFNHKVSTFCVTLEKTKSKSQERIVYGSAVYLQHQATHKFLAIEDTVFLINSDFVNIINVCRVQIFALMTINLHLKSFLLIYLDGAKK